MTATDPLQPFANQKLGEKMPLLEGSFQVPSGQTVDVRWHANGLEEYLVDGECVLSSKRQKSTFSRSFQAGSHEVRIDFSMKKFTCRGFIDNELAVPEVFKNFSNFHSWIDSFRIKALSGFPVWVHFLVWIGIIIAVGKLAKVGGAWIGALFR